jgi:hypothetical protein
MEKGETMTGGCLCGALRYEARPDLGTAYCCYCRDCQIGSGSAFCFAVYADQSSFRILSGDKATYSYSADSGNKVERVFCPKCGTAVYWTGEKWSEQVILTVSSLDDPGAIEPVREVWAHRAMPWSRIRGDALQKT